MTDFFDYCGRCEMADWLFEASAWREAEARRAEVRRRRAMIKLVVCNASREGIEV